MEDSNRKQLEEYVSPSDIPLFDLMASHIDNIDIIVNIFQDRNSRENTECFILGIIKSVIVTLTGNNIEMSKLYDFINDRRGKDDKK